MKYTRLGKSNLEISKICIGTMHFGSRTSESEAFEIMDKAFNMGINFFDTANVYSGQGLRGLSETIIGNWMTSRGVRDYVVIATKVFGNMSDAVIPNESPGISAYKVRRHANDSLRRLQTDRIDLYQVHHVDRNITPEEFWTTFDRLINDGKVLYLGGSNFSGWELATYQMHAMQRGMMGFISEQTMYNLVCRYPELELMPSAQAHGIGVIPYMPLAGGILTGKKQSDEGSRTSEVEEEYGIYLGDTNEQMNAFHDLCAEMGEPPHVVAIAWTLTNPAVSAPIVGVRTIEHLDGLERAVELEFDEDVLKRLDTIFAPNKGRELRIGRAPEAYAW